MRTTDVFLNAHLVDPYVFHIDGRLWPISIRDQMMRGRMIVERAVAQGLIHTGRDLAIVGGGAAGVTAALIAAELGIKVWLFEKDTLFSRHIPCMTRWVDPTQYDWQLGHWNAQAFPWPGTPTMPLNWGVPDYSYALAADWDKQYKAKYPRLSGFLTPMYPINVVGYTLASPMVKVHWDDPASGTVKSRDFGMLVLALGIGNEKTTVPSMSHAPAMYKGFEFWTTDPFSSPSVGCPANPNVFISGAGDGSLQDFLRITTDCKSASELWSNLPKSLLPTIKEIQDEEDQSNRAYSWGPTLNGEWDHQTLERIHQVHDRLTTDALKKTPVTTALDKMLRKDFRSIKVVHSCTHFGQAYSLNHFLALLVAKRLEALRPRLKPIFESNQSLIEVECLNHAPVGPATCHGHDHNISVGNRPTCYGAATGVKMYNNYQVVIIRHGIDPIYLRSKKGKGAPMPALRQLLPYHLPD